jgi:integrase
VPLKVRDIDSKRMLLRVERGKGGRYRNALLPADLLTLLREWWKVGRQQGVMHADGWLFPSVRGNQSLDSSNQHLRYERLGEYGDGIYSGITVFRRPGYEDYWN